MPSSNPIGGRCSSLLVHKICRGANCAPQSLPISPEITGKSLRLETDWQWPMTFIMQIFKTQCTLFLSLCIYSHMNLRECILGIPHLLPSELHNSFPPGALTTLSKQSKTAFHLRDYMLSSQSLQLFTIKGTSQKHFCKNSDDVLKIWNLGSATNLALTCYDSSSFVLHKIF